MKLSRAKIVRAASVEALSVAGLPPSSTEGALAPGAGVAAGRSGHRAAPRGRAAAPMAVARLLSLHEQHALDRASELRREAEAAAEALYAEARAGALEAGRAELAAEWLRLAERERVSLDGREELVLELARLLAERLLGEALELAPERVASLARGVLRAATGARSGRLLAHPDDVVGLERELPALGVSLESLELLADPSLARGDLLLETDAGTVDGRLRCQLERLVAALREARRS